MGRPRVWKICQALLRQASQRFASASELPSLVGHFNWAALLRLPLLCIFQSTCHRFIKQAGDNRWRLWPEVVRDLRAAAALVPFADCDAKRPVDTMVCFTDASAGDLDPLGWMFGGYGSTEREVDSKIVIETARVRKRWRCRGEGAINARGFAFANSDAPSHEQASFAAFDSELALMLEAWQDVTSGRWSREGAFLGLEGRALSLGIRHKMRAFRSRGHLHRMLNGDLSLVLQVGKGRSASPLINQAFRGICSCSIVQDISVAVRRLPSEWNTSDKASRTMTGALGLFAAGPRNVGTAWASLARGAAVEKASRDNYDHPVKRARRRGRCRYFDFGELGCGAPPPARAKAAGRAELARQKANRAKRRAPKFGGINCDPRRGLTFLQRRKVRAATIGSFDKHVASFLEWAEVPSLDAITVGRLDGLLAGYLDMLFWGGELAETGSRLLASVQRWLPRVPRPKQGGLPLARAALSGFQANSRGAPMMPVGKPTIWALIGIAALEDDFEWAGALALARDGMIRLPSDLVNVTAETLAGPGRAAAPRWAALAHPIEGSTRSVALAQDEGALLRGAAWRGGGGSFPRRPRAARFAGARLWSFGAAQFNAEFNRRLASVPGAPDAIPRQLRQSAARRAAAVEGASPMDPLQGRLRRASAQSAARHSRRVRHPAAQEKVNEEGATWPEQVWADIGQILGEQRRPQRPPFLLGERLESKRPCGASPGAGHGTCCEQPASARYEIEVISLFYQYAVDKSKRSKRSDSDGNGVNHRGSDAGLRGSHDSAAVGHRMSTAVGKFKSMKQVVGEAFSRHQGSKSKSAFFGGAWGSGSSSLSMGDLPAASEDDTLQDYFLTVDHLASLANDLGFQDLGRDEIARIYASMPTDQSGKVGREQFAAAVKEGPGAITLRLLVRKLQKGFAYGFKMPEQYDFTKPTSENYKVDDREFTEEFERFRRGIDYTYHNNYTLERQRWQDEVIKSTIVRSSEQPAPWLVFTCGPMGVGKGYCMNWMSKHGFFPLENIVHVDPDAFKMMMPEWPKYVKKSGEEKLALCATWSRPS
ncbi:unnamed protein product [Prorocentrum cordatum]|uniref:Zeta toxin domain-containing protein n=1 Tax=Prorocentrum cordatum TaxID=2364126 RepID=A0ABN9T2S1_9DINO|nr:unnamed protein product [Polarella glacialis]